MEGPDPGMESELWVGRPRKAESRTLVMWGNVGPWLHP
jgi:hypothetical protein